MAASRAELSGLAAWSWGRCTCLRSGGLAPTSVFAQAGFNLLCKDGCFCLTGSYSDG